MINKQLPVWLTDMQPVAFTNQPAWLAELRSKACDRFMQHGIPTRRHEQWKYSDLSKLSKIEFAQPPIIDEALISELVHKERMRADDSILFTMVNGCFMPGLSDLAKLPVNVVACGLAQAWEQHPELLEQNWGLFAEDNQRPFVGLNTTYCIDGLFLYLPPNTKLAAPVHLLSLTTGQTMFATHPRHVIVMGEDSRLMMLEEHVSSMQESYLLNQVMSIALAAEAKLEHYKIQRESAQGIHVATTVVKQQKNSRLSSTQFAVGADTARDDFVVQLVEGGAECSTAGLYCATNSGQYIDHHIDINHLAPNSHSEMLYKGIINHNARAVFNGRLHVGKEAQKIVAYQSNHNLLLADTAEVYSKPELEIYADDVKCKHGATTGQIDQEALFFMRSRGIPREEAMAILLQGFAQEVIERVSHPTIMLRVMEAI